MKENNDNINNIDNDIEDQIFLGLENDKNIRLSSFDNLKVNIEKKRNSNEENRLTLSDDLNEEERKSIIQNENIAQLGTRIYCPNRNCFLSSVILLNPIFFEVNSDCGKHINKMDIIDFIISSGKYKEEKETCERCKMTYQNIILNKNILYKCSCDKNICEKCKDFHLKNNNLNEHKLVDFNKKDYTCLCNNKNEKFVGYCVDCKKDFCGLCSEQHKNHKIINFNKFNIDKNLLKQKFIEQKGVISRFNKLVDGWLKRAQEFINLYKKKLELYEKINEKIIEQYDSINKNYKSIKNIEYLNFDFDDIVINLIKNQNNLKLHNNLICKFINENMGKYVQLKNYKNNALKNFEHKYSKDIHGYVSHICELKKKDILIINITKKDIYNTESLYICKKAADYNITKIYCSDIGENKILGLSELRNGNLLIIHEKDFQIYEVNEIGALTNLETHKFNDKEFKQVIELINGNLISLNHKKFKENEIIFWEKNLLKGEYEIKKQKELVGANSIVENDKLSFLVYCDNNDLYSFDSNTGKCALLIKLPMNLKHLIKMMKIGKNGFLLYYQDCLVLLNLKTKLIKQLKNTFNDICYAPNSISSFFASFSENINFKKKKLNSLCLIICDLQKNEIYCHKSNGNMHSEAINYIISLNNNDLITCSMNDKIKLWEKKE